MYLHFHILQFWEYRSRVLESRGLINRAKLDMQDDEPTDALVPVMLTFVRCRKEAGKQILTNHCLPEDGIFGN
jgi:hypothetical protein